MGTLLEDLKSQSAWIAKALQSSGYRADFSLESLREIDRFFEDHSSCGNPKSGGLLSQSLGSRLFALGAYVGEVLIRANGGNWRTNDTDPDGELNVEVVLPDGGIIWPVQRMLKRLKNGAEDGIYSYGRVITEKMEK